MQKVFRWRGERSKSEPKGATVPLVEYLQKVDIFKDLAREEIEVLFNGVTMRECATGTVFFTPDDPSERLFVLKAPNTDFDK